MKVFILREIGNKKTIINHYKDGSITPCGSGCSSQDIYPTAQHVYWTIPGSKFKNNLLSSYGSQIKFTLDFDGRTNNFNGLYCASIRGASTTLFATCDQVKIPPRENNMALMIDLNYTLGTKIWT